jgi:hypothetical protein
MSCCWENILFTAFSFVVMEEELIWRYARQCADNLRAKAKDNVDVLGALLLYKRAALMAKELSEKKDFGFRGVAGKEAKEIAEVAFTFGSELLKVRKRGPIFDVINNELLDLKKHFKFRALGI